MARDGLKNPHEVYSGKMKVVDLGLNLDWSTYPRCTPGITGSTLWSVCSLHVDHKEVLLCGLATFVVHVETNNAGISFIIKRIVSTEILVEQFEICKKIIKLGF